MFEEVISAIRAGFEALTDQRKGGNNSRYSLSDAALSAFSVFMMQSPSFLAHQRDMQRQKGRDNVQTLFGVHQTPSDNQIRNLLDKVQPSEMSEIFWRLFAQLEAADLLQAHRGIHNNLLCGIDGTQYFFSTAIHCEQCTQRQREGETHYSHWVIVPVLVRPDSTQVFTLEQSSLCRKMGPKNRIASRMPSSAGCSAMHTVFTARRDDALR